MLRFLSLIAVVLLAGMVAGQPLSFPKTTPPTFQQVREFDADRGEVQLVQPEWVPLQEKVVTKEIIEGRERLVERVVTKRAVFLKATVYKLADFEIVNGEGKKQTPNDVAGTIKERLVLVVPDESGLDPAYLKLLARDTIVFVRKKSEK
jgi:hypothetical protein